MKPFRLMDREEWAINDGSSPSKSLGYLWSRDRMPRRMRYAKNVSIKELVGVRREQRLLKEEEVKLNRN